MSPSPNRRVNREAGVTDALERYLASLDAGGSRSTMRSPLSRFADWCSTAGVDRVADLDARDLREYGLHLRERHADGEISASTANTYFKYVRAFLSFCVRDELLESNPANTNRATELLPEQRGRRDTQFWTRAQRTRLVSYASERVEMALEGTVDVSRPVAFRDRAIVVVLADTGVRGAELFRDTRDDDRPGLTWGDVDLERGTLEVFGKSREYETVGLPTDANAALEQLARVLEPPTDEWPVFPTAHAPSIYRAVRRALGDEFAPDELEALLAERDIDDLLREYGVSPPSLTKAGGRRVLKRLTAEAGIDVDGGYLKPHGARRALGAELYASGHSELAQSALRHKSIETTHETYTDIQATDVARSIDEIRK
ncbi:tyrosine-type recombinase/integrase [Natronobiforma cellulositropha]|uniref:tyrosine-type recombinase/integrase n=1 Tax=Natronobiforma cellulositropha TaxID=1679076 RepID=UPI0021D5B5BB|nr:tyrosine-type recombinase/integrase [Natronobiforma cellulositropha]